jgi:Cu/Ag efflux protein CusF
MKTVIASALLVLVSTLPLPGMAAGEHHHGHGATPSDTNMQSHAPASAQMVEGTVKKVDKATGKVTLAHGPLANLGMNTSMTMAFRVKEAAWLDRMKDGDKIRFAADNINGVLTVVKFEPAK